MDLSSLFLIATAGIVSVGLAIYLISLFNRLYSLRNSAEATLGQIGVALKKRLDLITQLVESVRAYVKFEREIFEKIARLRSEMLKGRAEDLRDIERESRTVMNTVLAIAESYPDLKASSTVLNLMDAIRSVEDEIARQRYTYNNIVQEFNIMQDTFPSGLVARAMKLGKLEYLRFEEETQKRPSVEV
ncbi:LemA family protein [Candidatus Bathyarchaeota archaeon]|nr:LemA family protein [Candidatus Bathyarchaeota archaeon]